MTLPSQWIDRIFTRLQGIYGQQFTAKFSRMDNGVDVGLMNAKEVWAQELGNFADKPEAIGYALNHLPTAHAPNAIEFRDICKRAPLKCEAVERLEYKPTAEDMAKQKQMAQRATEAVNRREFDGLLWAKRPKSQKSMDFVADGKKNANRFPALADVFDKLLADGICNEVGKLLYRWDGQGWVKL